MKEELNSEEKQALLALARAAIAKEMKLDHPQTKAPETPALSLKSGAFVTLHSRGKLRGCIGRFTSDDPITRTVEEMAGAAAFEDPRFPPLKPNELSDVDLEISVLTPMRQVDSPEEIQVGRHGIYIIKGLSRGVLLPQVATEQKWDRQTFLEHTCLKAGLDTDCWQDPKTEIYVFSAQVFSEKER